MNNRAKRALIGGLIGMLVLASCGTKSGPPTGAVTAGPRPDGTGVLPSGYVVTPAGQQTRLGDLPLGAAVSPDGHWLVVSNVGRGTQSLQVVDAATGAVTQTVPNGKLDALFTGLAFSADGRRLFASGGWNNTIRTFDVTNGALSETAPLALPSPSADGKSPYAFPAGLALTGDGRIVVADRLADAVTALDPRTGAARTVGVGHAPGAVVVSRDGNRAWVAEQGAETIRVLDVSSGRLDPVADIHVGTHPAALVLDKSGDRLFVAAADSDQVSVIDTGTSIVKETIALAPYPGAQVGANPIGLALSDDDKTLYVANSGDNDIAVLDTDRFAVRGLIPTGWYPSTVTVIGSKLFVTNAKGFGAGPNGGNGHPDPTRPGDPGAPDQYVGSMIAGTLSVINEFDQGQLDKWTGQVHANDGFDAHGEVRVAGQSPVVPLHPGQSSPIKHVIYVVKENRTFDQELGSLGKGNGEPSLNLFGDESVPNTRELQRRFVTLDNFYADAEISAQGWMWVVAANSNPYTESGWPANYSNHDKYPYASISESGDAAIAPNSDPADAYIWDRLAKAGVSFRNYGFYVSLPATADAHAQDRVLDDRTDHAYRGFDLNCPDSPNGFPTEFEAGVDCGAPRISEWQREFNGYVAAGTLPTVEFVRLPSDHTSATRTGFPTPQRYVQDNDMALGTLVDAVSHSKYWPETAIFVTEDDAQNGPDHVDAHRTVSQVISPYTQSGAIDSTFYSTASMLRTIELVVGLTPLTQFDAFATPMVAAFSVNPNTTPYQLRTPTAAVGSATNPPAATPATVTPTPAGPSTNPAPSASSPSATAAPSGSGSITPATNPPDAPMATESNAQNLSAEDLIDEDTFNRAIWASIKGPASVMPPPRHTVIADTRPRASATEAGDR
jgi:YVTN family beta-propeller protein